MGNQNWKLSRPVYRGEAYWVTPDAATGSEQGAERGRPGIIVSNDIENRRRGHVLMVFTTTRRKTGMPTHTGIILPKGESTVLCEQVCMVRKEQVDSYIDTCSHQDILKINRALGFSLNIGIKSSTEILAEHAKVNPYPRGGICAVKSKHGGEEEYPCMVLSNNIGNTESTILEVAYFKEGKPSSPVCIRLKSLPGWYLDLGCIDTVSKSRVRMQEKRIKWENLQKTRKAMELSLGLISPSSIREAYRKKKTTE